MSSGSSSSSSSSSPASQDDSSSESSASEQHQIATKKARSSSGTVVTAQETRVHAEDSGSSSGSDASDSDSDSEDEDPNTFIDERSVFVGRMPMSAGEDELRQFFTDVGVVTKVRVLMAGGRSRCCAFVEFASTQDAQAAVELDGQEMLGRRVRINGAGEKPDGMKHKHRFTAYVGNLNFITKESKLRGIFGNCGVIQRIDLPLWRDTGRLRGFAMITFNDEKSVQRALQLDGLSIDGRSVKVQRVKDNRNLSTATYKGMHAKLRSGNGSSGKGSSNKRSRSGRQD